jgi:Integrase zinc binding domain
VIFLSEFDFKLTWGPGVENVADGPSHSPDLIPQKGDNVLLGQCQLILTPSHTQQVFSSPDYLSTDLSSFFISMQSLHTLDNSALLKCFKTVFHEDNEWQESLVHGNSDFTAESSLVFHNRKPFVPKPLHTDILFSQHDSCLGGHPGQTGILAFVSHDYSWPGMQTFVWHYIRACDTCPHIKSPHHEPYGLSISLNVLGNQFPWISSSSYPSLMVMTQFGSFVII